MQRVAVKEWICGNKKHITKSKAVMKVELSTVLTVLSIMAIVGGFIMWILGRVLTDKKDKLTLAFEIEKLKSLVSSLKEDTDKIDHIQRELDIIKEQVKHL